MHKHVSRRLPAIWLPELRYAVVSPSGEYLGTLNRREEVQRLIDGDPHALVVNNGPNSRIELVDLDAWLTLYNPIRLADYSSDTYIRRLRVALTVESEKMSPLRYTEPVPSSRCPRGIVLLTNECRDGRMSRRERNRLMQARQRAEAKRE